MDEQGRLSCKTLTFKWLTVVVNRRGYSRALSKRMEPGVGKSRVMVKYLILVHGYAFHWV